MSKLEHFAETIACPSCHNKIGLADLTCFSCDKQFRKVGLMPIFDETWYQEEPAKNDWLNSLKEKVKVKLSIVYPLLVNILSPVAPTIGPFSFVKRGQLNNQKWVNLGCGTTRIHPDVLNIDQANYANVDMVASISELPFANNSLDGIFNIAVLEHVSNPIKVVEEFQRVLKVGGQVICFVPFIQGIHASPYDFQRYTPEGLKVLFNHFEIKKIQPIGPTSGLVWVLQEWLAMMLSFGIRPLYRMLVPLTWILSPIKYLDYLLKYHPQADNISSGYYFVAVKK